MKTYDLKVSGMTCSGCEQRLTKALLQIEGVRQVEASAVNDSIRLSVSNDFSQIESVTDKIQMMGYEVEQVTELKLKPGQKTNPNASAWGQAAGLIGLAALVWLISPALGLNRFTLPENIGYLSLFIIGLTTSVHCIGMCGGISMSISLNASQQKSANPFAQVTKANAAYQMGRVLSYTAIGGLAGLVGASFGIHPALKVGVTLLAGLLMVLMGLNLLGFFGQLSKYLPKPPAALFRLRDQARKLGPFAVGVVNGFIPCGPLQAMQLYALSTADPVTGALSMFAFSLGTVPALFGFGLISGRFGKQLKGTVLKFSGVLVILLGFMAFERGLSMTTLEIPATIGNTATEAQQLTAADGVVATIKDGYQEVTITVTPSGYEPIIVQKGLPVKWNLKAAEADLTGCNSGIIVKEYGIETGLVPGDNWVEFTPDASGSFRYTCWMGMIRSKIHVVDDLTTVK